MAIHLLKPFWFVLVLPALTALAQYLITGSAKGVFAAEIVVFCLILLICVLRSRKYKIAVYKNKICIFKGLFFKLYAEIPFSALSAVTVRQSLFEMPFRVVTVIFNTEAGYKENGFKIKLYKNIANEIINLIYSDKKRPAIRFSAKTLALSALLSSSAFTGLVVAVPLINRLGKLFGTALSRMLFDEISSVSKKFNTYFPPIFNTVMLILLLAYIFAAVNSFVKAYNFRLFAGKEYIEVHSGLFVREKTIFRKSAVTDVSVEQTFLMYIFKRYMLCACVAGFGKKGGRKAILIPCEKKETIYNLSILNLSFMRQNGTILRPLRSKSMMLRFIKVPIIIFATVSAAVLTTTIIIPYFERFILLAGVPFLFSAVYLGFYFYYNYLFGKISFGENIYARAAFGLSFKEMYLPFKNIALIKLSRGIIARKKGSCNVKITVNSQNANRIRVWHLDYRSVKDNLKEITENNSNNKGNTDQ